MNQQVTAADAIDDATGFADAMAELETILRRLEGDRVDVDHLAADVRRAGDLIKVCRERIARTKLEIDEIVAGIDSDTADAPG